MSNAPSQEAERIFLSPFATPGEDARLLGLEAGPGFEPG
jgi:hypothetical protein